MIVLNLEIINSYRGFEYLVLNFLCNDILTIGGNKNIPCAKLYCLCPALLRNIERVSRSRGYCFSVAGYLDQLIRLSFKCLNYSLEAAFPCLRVCGIDIISLQNFIDAVFPFFRSCSRNKACIAAFCANVSSAK